MASPVTVVIAVLRSLISDVSEFAVCVSRDERSDTILSVCVRLVTSAVMLSDICLMLDLFSVAIVWALVASASRYATSCFTCVAEVAGSVFCVAPECFHAAYDPDTE